MGTYTIPIEEIKTAVAVSLSPDEAYELACGATKVILMDSNEGLADLVGRYCILHAANLTGEDLELSNQGFEALEVDPDVAPCGSILGYCKIAAVKKYDQVNWRVDMSNNVHPHDMSLEEFLEDFGAEQLYGVIVERPMLLGDQIYDVDGGISEGFWNANHPEIAALFRAVFEDDRAVLDIDRELTLPAMMGQ